MRRILDSPGKNTGFIDVENDLNQLMIVKKTIIPV
jgi:hypothetical protein